MTKIIEWIKENKLTALLFALIILLVAKNFTSSRIANLYEYKSAGLNNGESFGRVDYYATDAGSANMMPATPTSESFQRVVGKSATIVASTESSARKTIEESNLSILVKDVSSAISSTQTQAELLNGYLISSNVNRPNESTNGQISVRVPLKSRTEFLTYIKSLGIKTITENYSGYDITDAYTDNEARLATLNQTKAKFEEIFSQATKIDDILRVQNELINIQYQIDAIKGQQKALEQSSSTTRISINFASDEFALPFAPDTNWNPANIFKLAVRSLVLNLRGIANSIIWIAVYAAIWLPIALAAFFVWKKFFKKI